MTAAGVVDLAALERLLAGRARPLVSLMLANNETGVIQPVAEAAALVHAAGGLLHVDAVQGAGPHRLRFQGARRRPDDAVVAQDRRPAGRRRADQARRRCSLDPLIKGGGQERGARAGTENVAGIAGFGAAAEAVRQGWAEEAARMAALRDRLEAGIKAVAPKAVIFGAEAAAAAQHDAVFACPGMKAETAVIAFDLEGVAVSSGAACSSGKVAPSHVLAAMGVPPELARGAIRVSLGYATTDEDVGTILKAWEKLSESLYKAGNQQEIAA